MAAQLESNLGSRAQSRFSDEQGARLDAAGAPELGFPRAFLESDHVRALINGETVLT